MCIQAYAAGLLDGEGCIHICKGTEHPLQVIFEMCDVEPLELLSAQWGGNVMVKHNRTVKGRIRYRWSIWDSHALEFLADIEPWVFGKAAQVKVALVYPMFGRGHGALPDTIRQERRKLGEQLKELKAPPAQ